MGKQTTIWLTYLLLNLKYICDSFHLSWRATLHMNIKLCSFLTLHKTCKGLRTGRRDWQGHFVHRHSISYCQTIDTTKWDFSSQQLPQQHTITFRFFKKEKIKNSCWKKKPETERFTNSIWIYNWKKQNKTSTGSLVCSQEKGAWCTCRSTCTISVSVPLKLKVCMNIWMLSTMLAERDCECSPNPFYLNKCQKKISVALHLCTTHVNTKVRYKKVKMRKCQKKLTDPCD